MMMGEKRGERGRTRRREEEVQSLDDAVGTARP